METTEKKKQGSSKGKPSELIKSIEYNQISAKSPQDVINYHRAKVEDWLNGSQDYSKGLKLLSKDKNKTRVFLKLNSRKSNNNQQKLVHELTAFLSRTKPKVIIEEPEKNISPISNMPENIASMENLSIAEKIQKWFSGPRDYATGRALLKSIPDTHLVYRQLTEMETFESRIRLYKTFRDIEEMLREARELDKLKV